MYNDNDNKKKLWSQEYPAQHFKMLNSGYELKEGVFLAKFSGNY